MENDEESDAVDKNAQQPRVQLPVAAGTSKRPGEIGDIFPGRATSSGVSNWLTDPTMLAGALDRARVLVLSYAASESDQVGYYPNNLGYNNDVLDKTAAAILTQLKEKRIGKLCNVPLVFIGNGFGCLILQKLIALAAKNQEPAAIVDMTAAIVFFDTPTFMGEGDYDPGKRVSFPFFTARANSIHSTSRTKADSESEATDNWNLWQKFNSIIREKDISTAWFHMPNQAPRVMHASSRSAGIDFCELQPIHTSSPNDLPALSFSGPHDSNYHLFISKIKGFLLLKASSDERLSHLLTQFISSGYALNFRDHKGRSPLHRAAAKANLAALRKLVKKRPDLVNEKDEEGSTPLHMVIKAAVGESPTKDRKKALQTTARLLLSALSKRRDADNLKDNAAKSAWDYINDEKHRWIQDLRYLPSLREGAKAASTTHQDLVSVFEPIPEDQEAACKNSDALLTQFYVPEGTSNDFVSQRRNVFAVIYDSGAETILSKDTGYIEGKQVACRWIHLPANNERWVHDLFIRQLQRIDESTSLCRHEGRVLFDRHMTPSALNYNHQQIYVPQPGEASYQEPTIMNGVTKGPVTALFMPILGFEKHGNRKNLSSTMREPSYEATDMMSRLIHTYYRSDKFPLHCRRTLDQFTYYMLDDTEDRDNTQVIFKWFERLRNQARKKIDQQQIPEQQGTELTNKDGYPVLMIDQLWLWILEDEQIVITSLPTTWESTDEYNFGPYFIDHNLIENNDSHTIEDALDLVNSIVRWGIDFLHRKGPLEATLYNAFQSSITIIDAEQAEQFKAFDSLVMDLNKNDIGQSERAALTNKLFEVAAETHQLTEILDIQDELKTILQVFLQQKEVLSKLVAILSTDKSNNSNSSKSSEQIPTAAESTVDTEHLSPYGKKVPAQPISHGASGRPRNRHQSSQARMSRFLNQADANLYLVDANIETIREMNACADKVQMEIKGLLDLKQRHASAWEARFAREAAEQTRRQSDITMVFTIVTVFFLPLSFISSLFAIQIDVFPQDSKSGDVKWPWREAFGLIFGISSGVILLIIFLFRDTLISHFNERFSDALHGSPLLSIRGLLSLFARFTRRWYKNKEKVEDDEKDNGLNHYVSAGATGNNRDSPTKLLRRRTEPLRLIGRSVAPSQPPKTPNLTANLNSRTFRNNSFSSATRPAMANLDVVIGLGRGTEASREGSHTAETTQNWGRKLKRLAGLLSFPSRKVAKERDLENGFGGI
ncbi:hypothetical protein F4777DRAFT_560431 [Nemania sp. FL0916]|nr:hypothetical protein F4777DRAFT_560431 [Nemania sp. FL0916]